MKRCITATDLYNFKKCPYRPFLDRNGDPSEKVALHPLIQLLWEAGVQYERQVIEMLRRENQSRSFLAISPESPASDELASQTLEAMKAGADVIYQGVLLHDDLLGRPDLLVKTDGRSTLGEHSYYPMDIKLARVEDQWDDGNEKATLEQLWQLYFYAQLLNKIQGVVPAYGYIYKTKSRKLPVRCTNAPRGYEQALLDLRAYIQGDSCGATPTIGSACPLCHWVQRCTKWADEKGDVSKVFYVGIAFKRGIQKLGINTVDELAAQSPDEFTAAVERIKAEGQFWPSMPRDLPRKSVFRARTLKDGNPKFYAQPNFSKNEIEIYYDIEDDPTQDFVYLHGLVIREGDGKPQYRYFFADKRDEEERVVCDLFKFLSQYPNAVIFHYSAHEKSTLKRLFGRYSSLASADFDRIFGKTGTAVDLYQWIFDSSDWPLTSYGIKSICKYLGFKWQAEDAGGAASILWMNAYLQGDAAQKQKILQYNEDDCRAMLYLKEKLPELWSKGLSNPQANE